MNKAQQKEWQTVAELIRAGYSDNQLIAGYKKGAGNMEPAEVQKRIDEKREFIQRVRRAVEDDFMAAYFPIGN